MNIEKLIEKHLSGKQNPSVNDIRAMLNEHAQLILSDVAQLLSSSLGEAEGNVYEIVFEDDGQFWIYHKFVESGEPLKQWIDEILENIKKQAQ
jgi:hypothetical protein